jgi:hydrogenase nickel incorporation protein HypA/HybF
VEYDFIVLDSWRKMARWKRAPRFSAGCWEDADMHERSLVKSLIEQVCEEARLRKLGRVHVVRLELGEFSGVEPPLVELAFEELAPQSWDHPVRIEVTVVPLTAKCSACGTTFHVVSFRFVCPNCHSSSVDVEAGEEMRLASLEAEPSPSPQSVHEESAA